MINIDNHAVSKILQHACRVLQAKIGNAEAVANRLEKLAAAIRNAAKRRF